MLGLYLHVPFCRGKCPYCDFYSLPENGETMDRYTEEMEKALLRWGEEHGREEAETVYFGGGTPNLLGPKRLLRLLNAVKTAFSLNPEAEITLEANPTYVDQPFFQELRQGGFNRLSLGVQSGDPEQLKFLGRSHSPEEAARAVEAARSGGFENLSLDLMLGLPGDAGETREKLLRSISFVTALEPEHLSAYLLKVEEGTPFAAQGVQIPEGDEAAEQYLMCVEELEKRGFSQYEISNFSKPGRESRHNLIYWRGEEYLGFGPGAHSFYRGKRFYYPRDLAAFLKGAPPCPDGEGGYFEEYAMLNLRLTRGLRREDCKRRFGQRGEEQFEQVLARSETCPAHLVLKDRDRLSFTPEGFLVSNALLLRLISPEE